MAFGMQDEGEDVMNEINMTPLVDVMLVLLIVFMITIPVMQHSVNVQLPRASAQPEQPQAQTLRLSVSAQGAYFLGEQAMDDAALEAALRSAAAQQPQPELHIRGDREVRYERVAQAMATAQQAGLQKIGFITEPMHMPARP
jgi:biopolymer transport protein ExbD